MGEDEDIEKGVGEVFEGGTRVGDVEAAVGGVGVLGEGGAQGAVEEGLQQPLGLGFRQEQEDYEDHQVDHAQARHRLPEQLAGAGDQSIRQVQHTYEHKQKRDRDEGPGLTIMYIRKFETKGSGLSGYQSTIFKLQKAMSKTDTIRNMAVYDTWVR